MDKPTKTREEKLWVAIALITLAAVVALVVMFDLAIVSVRVLAENKGEIRWSDFLAVTVPVLGSFIALLFYFFGINKFKDFDKRQNELEKRLTRKVEAKAEEMGRLAGGFLADVEGELKGIAVDVCAQLNEADEKYRRLFGDAEGFATVADAIGSLREAQNYLQNNDEPRLIKALVKRVSEGEIGGSSEDYIDFAAELSNRDLSREAFLVAKKGFGKFSNNINLTAAYVRYAISSGEAGEAEAGLEKLLAADYNCLGQEAFVAAVDALNLRESSFDNKQEALKIIEEYKQALPDDERAYMAEYETLLKYGNAEGAVAALEYAEKRLAMTALCSLKLAEIYHKRGEFDAVIYSATRSLISQADPQSGDGTGAAFAYRAYARDAKLSKAMAKGSDVDKRKTEVNLALDDYEAALRFGWWDENISTRMSILNGLLPTDERRELTTSELSW